MNRLFKIAFAGALALSLVACVGNAGNKQVGGTLLGAGAGGLIGSQFGSGRGKMAAVGIGVLLGALVGSEVGKSLDRADRAAMSTTTQQSLESTPDYKRSNWSNPNTRNYGSVTPTRTWQGRSGQYCREYQQTVTVGGRTRQAYGNACRQPDGQWKIINQ